MSCNSKKRNYPFSDETPLNHEERSTGHAEDAKESANGLKYSKVAPLYLDYNVDTPLDPQVLEAVVHSMKSPITCDDKDLIEEARDNIGQMIAANRSEIIFASCPIECIYGVLKNAKIFFNNWSAQRFPGIKKKEKPHVICATAETVDSISFFKRSKHEIGFDITYVPVDKISGYVSVESIIKAITPSTCLITLSRVNYVTGIIQPFKDLRLCLDELGKSGRFHKPLLHSDISNALGRIEVDVKKLGLDFASISGDKMYGPKICALYMRHDLKLTRPIYLTEESHKQRTSLIVGLGRAAFLISNHLSSYKEHFAKLKKHFKDQLIMHLKHSVEIMSKGETITNGLCVSFKQPQAFGCLMERKILCPNIRFAMRNEVVSILKESGVSCDLAKRTLSISFGRKTTEHELSDLVKDLVKVLCCL